ncbi:MAG: hypothetical protein A2Y17_08265 [Clostridiales bacterium GWF2_38_85]|nr:MAG: hypothetical protein A2Y17_08265 [Clostridiales bacterium GWF2_38_85]HBL83813.1 transglycosylase [Clostridiales bacterium]
MQTRKIISIVFAVTILIALGILIYNIYADKILRKSYPLEYVELVEKYSAEYAVPKELIYSVIRTESRFDPDAKSHAGAVGLMQIMPDTRGWIMFRLGIEDEVDILDPEVNIKFGTYLLSYLMTQFQDESSIIAAYNAGNTKVKTWLTDSRYSDDGITLKDIPYPETEAYVEKVFKAREIYIKLYFENEGESVND